MQLLKHSGASLKIRAPLLVGKVMSICACLGRRATPIFEDLAK